MTTNTCVIAGSGRGPADRARITALGGGFIPLQPKFTYPLMPTPPLMPDTLPTAAQREFLATGFRSAMKLLCHQESGFFLRDRGKSANFALLDGFAAAIAALNICPALWIAFSFTAFAETVTKEKPPAGRWVFSYTRLETQRPWFYSTVDNFKPIPIKPPKVFRALFEDWSAMWSDLLLENPATALKVREVVNRHFPRDSFERREDAVKAAARALTRDLEFRAASGHVLWTL